MLDYALSHLEEHAASIRSTIAAYGDGDPEAVAYWTKRLASIESALRILRRT